MRREKVAPKKLKFRANDAKGTTTSRTKQLFCYIFGPAIRFPGHTVATQFMCCVKVHHLVAGLADWLAEMSCAKWSTVAV